MPLILPTPPNNLTTKEKNAFDLTMTNAYLALINDNEALVYEAIKRSPYQNELKQVAVQALGQTNADALFVKPIP